MPKPKLEGGRCLIIIGTEGTPLLLGLFSLVMLWACELAARTGKLPVLGAAWYKNPDPAFSNSLAAVRRLL